ncbi:MAG: RNA polymerase sigma factor [bacterium]|nr:RNA polymerase sigma factor [bacterium]
MHQQVTGQSFDEERELVKQAQGGDHAAFLALLGRYDRQIMSVVYRFTCDEYDREDLYQEVFLHCFRSIGKFRFQSSLLTWLYRLAMNRSVTYMRKKRPTAEPVELVAPELDWERREKLRTIRRASNRLNGRQRICFHLFYIEGWALVEIAEVLDCREGTVKSHLNRARSRIRRDREVLAWLTNT